MYRRMNIIGQKLIFDHFEQQAHFAPRIQVKVKKEGIKMKKIAMTTVVLLGLLAMISLASANTITLTGTIRDFTPQTNSDFEAGIGGLVTGIVQTTLGADGKPVYAHGDSSYGSIQNSTSFNQWYNGGDATNKLQYPITLENSSAQPSIYTYTNNSFFPIDGQLLGNYGTSGHNYHFTYEIHTDFTYLTGQNFSFTGDDDV